MNSFTGFSRIVFGFLFISVLLSGCAKDYDSIEQQDDKDIQAYIKSSGLQMQQYGTTGIYYQVVRAGSGPALMFDQKCAVTMTVKSIKGDFAALDTFASFNRFGNYFGYLGIKGAPVNEDIPKLLRNAGVNRGGSIRLIIPSRLLFGKNPSKVSGYATQIPGNTCLDVTMNVVDDSKQAVYDDLVIQKYIQANNLSGFVKHASGTYYKITAPGSTTDITSASTVTVAYTGQLLNGFQFDSAASPGAALPLTSVIEGWKQTLPLIKKGGSIELIIPSYNAYGLPENVDALGVANIPAFSCLRFSIQVLDVTN